MKDWIMDVDRVSHYGLIANYNFCFMANLESPSSSLLAPMDPSASMPAGLRLLLQNFNSLIHIKLENTNYNLWRAQIYSVLDAHDLLPHVLAISHRPSMIIKDAQGIPVSNPEFLRWQLIDKHLRSCLFASITPRCCLMSSPFQLHQIGQALERFHSLSVLISIELKMRLLTLNKGTKSMQAYLDDVKVITDSLAAVNETVKDEDLMLYILRVLSPEFEAFKATFRLNMNRSLSIHEFTGLLIAEELNLNLQKPAKSIQPSETSTVLFTSYRGRGNPRGRGFGRSGGRHGNFSGGRGNYNSGGRNSFPGRSNFSPAPSIAENRSEVRTWCQICGKPFHRAIDCWYRDDFNTYASTKNPRGKQALIANPCSCSLDRLQVLLGILTQCE
ncbi:hypothetical protein DH2020_027456 [Rehmannia glutinosa]|uniref:Uncharacterized protein n=1 Tax=Rehmannia glutinosa TaxID=99300 RepID=A0ABR0VX27_REHGL